METSEHETHGLCLALGGLVALCLLVVGLFAGAAIMKHRSDQIDRLAAAQSASFHVEFSRLNAEAGPLIDELSGKVDEIIKLFENESGLRIKSVELRSGDQTIHLDEEER